MVFSSSICFTSLISFRFKPV